jgi:hypothetical protein
MALNTAKFLGFIRIAAQQALGVVHKVDNKISSGASVQYRPKSAFVEAQGCDIMSVKTVYASNRQRAMREAYWINTPRDSYDLWPLSSALSGGLGGEEASADQIKALLLEIPDSLFGSGVAWGFNDTRVSSELHTFVLDNLSRIASAVSARTMIEPQGEPSPMIRCWSCRKSLTLDQRTHADGGCPHCDVEIELDI